MGKTMSIFEIKNEKMFDWAIIRVWKGFCMSWDLAETESMMRENKINSFVICEFFLGCDGKFCFICGQ